MKSKDLPQLTVQKTGKTRVGISRPQFEWVLGIIAKTSTLKQIDLVFDPYIPLTLSPEFDSGFGNGHL